MLTTLEASLDMQPLAEALYPSILESQLLGQAQIAGNTVAFAIVEDLPFAILDPEEALAFFAELLDLTEPQWTALLRGIAGLTRHVADEQRAMMTALVGDALLTAIEEGSTLLEFQDRIVALFKEELPGTSPALAQLETVFRTNTMQAYQVGRYQQMVAMASVRPYWQYHAIPDSRVRPTHLAQNGKVYRADHPFWQRWYPPNGFHCRCTVVALAASELEEFGLTPETADAPDAPDEGFRQNVGELWTSRR
jgi:SPP1 gp7 family putative phage head morphogenesis protein